MRLRFRRSGSHRDRGRDLQWMRKTEVVVRGGQDVRVLVGDRSDQDGRKSAPGSDEARWLVYMPAKRAQVGQACWWSCVGVAERCKTKSQSMNMSDQDMTHARYPVH